MKITLLDTQTGATKEIEIAFEYLWNWTDGNYSCDCNRDLEFNDIKEIDDNGLCLGCNRYIVVKCDGALLGEPIDIKIFNYNYPKELLIKHGIMI